MKSISARNKGLITGAVMILISIGIYLTKGNFENSLQYITYTVYVAGILWTLFTFKKETENNATFKQYFAEGFKCFIVVTLLMVLFTLTFLLLHPELKEQMAAMMREDIAKMKDITPLDVENKVATAKKAFIPSLVIGAVFGYLAIGSLISVIAAGFLSSQKK
ncbi:DUF4199 domain-containing protein [Ferruginibacter sp.]